MIYCEFIQNFIRENNIGSVVDLGCGDFRVGRLIDWENVEYTGIDLVPALIDLNNQEFGSKNINFLCLNTLKDELPIADLCMIRHVFQHLSNHHINQLLAKGFKYKYILITDCQPSGLEPHVKLNKDKPTDHLTRSDLHGTGLYLEAPPFCINLEVVLDYQATSLNGRFRTFLIRN